jgi:hypothetical protein
MKDNPLIFFFISITKVFLGGFESQKNVHYRTRDIFQFSTRKSAKKLQQSTEKRWDFAPNFGCILKIYTYLKKNQGQNTIKFVEKFLCVCLYY